MSLDMTGFLNDVKRAAVEAVKAGKPFSLAFGKVISTSPLTVEIDQKLKLSASQLILTNAVRDFKASVTTDAGTKELHIHLALTPGERVLLLCADGGQKFIILDRAEAPS